MGKYQKKQQVQKIKSTVGAGNKQKKTKKGKGKAHKKSIAAKIAAAKQKKKAGLAEDVDTIGDASMAVEGSTPGSTDGRSEAVKVVNFLTRARTEAKAMDALRKALNAGPSQEALGALLTHCAGRGLAAGVQLLLERSAPMNQPDHTQEPGRTSPLQLAASRGHVNAVRLLVQAGADKTGALEASQDLAKLGAVFAEEKRAIQAVLK
mmetsp:Transcript_106656/g.270848  ORF Transcript_106656/g.270848 Transcript_106656/m.270848 type:complete len:207 (-) Transcript_106656:244-864(-)|eukprot:CAMPEP_0183431608 /NCGR_PEP_ID=MMETSP0370-20130417/54935_1 /TAXON_ID=268820 /ORGANISM="Peridinium aciculiferum, Strain PAER-2" /LENGTH=206 /DNA_ID=CAMNT_0025617339 /DNA_START=51 /DNA_END=671 /DNA_ORIENTATION=-